MKQAGYFADSLGARYPASLEAGLDFTKRGLPEFIRSAKGVSDYESWGRWSDNSKTTFEFTDPLPDTFTLVLKAQAYAANAGQPIRVVVGDHEYAIVLTAAVTEVRLPVDLKGTVADSILFFPPHPISPREVNGSGDERKLGIGFVSLRIVQ